MGSAGTGREWQLVRHRRRDPRHRLLDARATDITDEMLVAAARAIADVVSPDQPNASYIVRSVLDEKVSHAVSRAVVAASPSRLHPVGGAKESAMR